MVVSKRSASITAVHGQLFVFTVLVTVNSPCVSDLQLSSGRLALHGQLPFFTLLHDRELLPLAVNLQFFTSSPGFRSFSPIL
ncbi:unnamed protein product [Linum trigynum]|uniref:Secreted protein n=1 Tax=Linum trigynum TaxID=586398 RepID=A0AAV2D8I3_9ROSI